MDNIRLPGEPPVEVAVRLSGRARNYSLRVSSLDGRVTLTLPKYGNMDEAVEFARSREEWIRQNLAKQPDVVEVRMGTEIPYLGHLCRIVPSQVRTPCMKQGELLVPPEPERVGIRVATFLKASARHHLIAASEKYAADLGRSIGRVTLRDTRSRWGSCTASGDLMYSWRLIMAPPEVLDYVAAHEVAHFIEMNHSQAYWDVVAKLCPYYRPRRAWLKREGMALHRYRFGN